MRVDLHVHSTASDGLYAPAEVVRIALSKNMDVIALTDHDTIDGSAAALAAAREATPASRLEVIAGVELSAEEDGADRHILGYLLDTESPTLKAALTELREARVHRADRIVQKLDELGVHVPLERVYALAGDGSVGRPHVARALIEQGTVGSVQEAFDRYLGNDGPAYVPHHRLTPADAIRLVHDAGGVAVLAHPGRLEHGQPREIIEAMVPLGLDGLEVYYPDHTPALVEELRELARRFDLVMTVGSDFHRREGDGTARIGSVKTPADFDPVAALKARAARTRPTPQQTT
jgi:predicted metal-dependent phosphoesterase TrpH